jgi:hypothetical protein
MVRRARCQCGGFTATAATEPGVVMACHCTWCQRRSGVPVTFNAYFKKDDVRLEGDYKVFERPAPEGRNTLQLLLSDLRHNAGVASRSASGRARDRGWVFHGQELPATIGVNVGRDDARMDQAHRGNAALSSCTNQLKAV